jgi:hypothetical protein
MRTNQCEVEGEVTKEHDEQGKEHCGIASFAAAWKELNGIVEIDLSLQSASVSILGADMHVLCRGCTEYEYGRSQEC